ncbi:hypothetical protein [Amphritea sp. HPY]|uniref:hypothetical protein n=1 Tax=Amphritea sp. HPY TaxID=3421652 RepID=UPI003D7F0902
MPHCQQIDSDSPQGKRTIKNLIALKAQLQMAGVSAALPQKNIDEPLLLATWNIRGFDRPAYSYGVQTIFLANREATSNH